MLYMVERELQGVVDLTKFRRFYTYWHKWIEGHMEELTAREFLLAGNILTAMDDFSDYMLLHVKEYLEGINVDGNNNNNNNNENA